MATAPTAPHHGSNGRPVAWTGPPAEESGRQRSHRNPAAAGVTLDADAGAPAVNHDREDAALPADGDAVRSRNPREARTRSFRRPRRHARESRPYPPAPAGAPPPHARETRPEPPGILQQALLAARDLGPPNTVVVGVRTRATTGESAAPGTSMPCPTSCGSKTTATCAAREAASARAFWRSERMARAAPRTRSAADAGERWNGRPRHHQEQRQRDQQLDEAEALRPRPPGGGAGNSSAGVRPLGTAHPGRRAGPRPRPSREAGSARRRARRCPGRS